MNVRKSITAAALVLAVAAPGALAKDGKGKQHKQHKKERTEQTQRLEEGFNYLDTNRDGLISRTEFPADTALFNRLDTNRNGYLSQTEARAFARSGEARQLATEYRDLDRNRDNVISRSEWRGDYAAFDRLDRNRDGVLSQADRYASAPTNQPTRFNGLDRNHDGLVTRSEWRGNDTSFRNQDRNRDGVLSGTELRR
jgi:Ca2+-binding EF-hand superfamily protein